MGDRDGRQGSVACLTYEYAIFDMRYCCGFVLDHNDSDPIHYYSGTINTRGKPPAFFFWSFSIGRARGYFRSKNFPSVNFGVFLGVFFRKKAR